MDIQKVMETYEELSRAMDVSVKISHGEVLKIVVRDLISKRNSAANEIKDSFDNVLRYYLSQQEFEMHVINGEPIE
jgi:hypothetical protein